MEPGLDEKVTTLCTNQAEWSQRTFGSDAKRGPTGALRHLQSEAEEAIEAIGSESYAEEVADCFLLVIDAARRGGLSFEALIDAARAKQVINLQRNWPAVGEDDGIPVEHIRDEE